MNKLLFCALLVGINANSFAAAVSNCQVKSIFDLAAYGSESVKGINLKSNGSIGSGAQVHLSKSDIDNSSCKAIVSAGSITLIDSTISGPIEGPNNKLSLQNTKVVDTLKPTGKVSKSLDANKLRIELFDISKKSFSKKQTESLKLIRYKESLTVSLKSVENVLTISSEALLKIKNLEIRGRADQTLIINVTGDSAVLNLESIDLSGTIGASRIIWNFGQAKTLVAKNSLDQIVGVPGRILAPGANVKIENALISGGVYAKSIEFNLNGLDQNSQITKN